MKIVITALCFLFTFMSLSAQDSSATSESIFTLLQQHKVANITIKTDLDSLINVRRRTTYQPATFTYEATEGEQRTAPVKLRPRGKYRRRVCDFPTIKLNFSKKKLKANGMSKYDDYKLVTHCLNDKKVSQENVLREYLVYKMYNLLSEESYQVQYLNLTYIDSKGKKNKLQRAGFIIEDTGELEDRIDVEVFSDAKLPLDSFDREQLLSVALFQYMIGNVDWRAIGYTKNAKTLKKKGASTYQVLPYDFDFSGLVQVSYGRLAEHLNQKDQRQRIFLGPMTSSEDLRPTIAHFQAKKAALLDLINNFDLLSKPSRKNIRKYIESFYEDIADGEVNTI
ncbi:MAG: hypothetical protein AAF960_23025 [Bacteroidota bacterium]